MAANQYAARVGDKTITHECILDLHRALVRLCPIGRDLEVGHDGSNSGTDGDMGEVLAAALASTHAKGHQVLQHPVQIHQ